MGEQVLQQDIENLTRLAIEAEARRSSTATPGRVICRHMVNGCRRLFDRICSTGTNSTREAKEESNFRDTHLARANLLFLNLTWYWSNPHVRQTLAEKASDECINRSMIRLAAPYAMRQSRSISPSRSPPSRDRPSVGCRVKTARGPLARACALSKTMCFSF